MYVYGYPTATALNMALDGIIDQYGAAECPATTPPGWQTWHFKNVAAQAMKGRLLGAAEAGTS
ncbi:hypothetical protein [Arthrobacter oryzae]|uniref:Uncharacterized protein n=1 Tax=Arthrobacter oryzae TaxID=409290 RepID=A0A3N0C413_9MICC|nr:hypothetical protein [Arthrobacter oryzae]RNL57381.1 hypothetical protein D7003_06305 [Arthrobacter oryzae]